VKQRELVLLLVIVLQDIIIMKQIIFVKNVLNNAKLVLLILNVLFVVNSETFLQFVHVKQDIMKQSKMNVKNVVINVQNVQILLLVLPALKIVKMMDKESNQAATVHLVIMMITRKTQFVKNVA